jgi:hypothetical protein
VMSKTLPAAGGNGDKLFRTPDKVRIRLIVA